MAKILIDGQRTINEPVTQAELTAAQERVRFAAHEAHEARKQVILAENNERACRSHLARLQSAIRKSGLVET